MLRESPAFTDALAAALEAVRAARPMELRPPEQVLLASDSQLARAHARDVASRLRLSTRDIESILTAAGQEKAAAAARLASEALTTVLSETYDGEAEVFACRRGGD